MSSEDPSKVVRKRMGTEATSLTGSADSIHFSTGNKLLGVSSGPSNPSPSFFDLVEADTPPVEVRIDPFVREIDASGKLIHRSEAYGLLASSSSGLSN